MLIFMSWTQPRQRYIDVVYGLRSSPPPYVMCAVCSVQCWHAAQPSQPSQQPKIVHRRSWTIFVWTIWGTTRGWNVHIHMYIYTGWSMPPHDRLQISPNEPMLSSHIFLLVLIFLIFFIYLSLLVCAQRVWWCGWQPGRNAWQLVAVLVNSPPCRHLPTAEPILKIKLAIFTERFNRF